MIERAITSKDLTSSYYLKNLEIAEAWEALSQSKQGEISGIVNGACCEFKMKFKEQFFEVSVEGVRRKSNVNAGQVVRDSYVLSTVVNISPVDVRPGDWKIYPTGTIRNLLNRLVSKCVPLKELSGYTLAYKGQINISEIIENWNLVDLFKIAEVRSIQEYDNELHIEYFDLIKPEFVEWIVRFIIK